MLFKLSVRNIAHSVKDYTVYFFTLIVGVAIFYVFNAIESQTVMLNVSSSTREIIQLMTTMLSGVSVFVSFVLGFLIIYASRFLMKRRNKEFALYLLLGMGKRKISVILFLETLMIGLISLAVGIVIGTGLSQLMSILVANLFEADMTAFQFVFSGGACVRTILYFGVMYLIVILFQTVMVNRCKLIDLLQSGRQNEKITMKNPWLCIFVFLVSVAMLGTAYYLVTAGVEHLQRAEQILIPIALGSVSTFLIFWSLSGLILKLVQARKGLYFKGLNCFTLRQISSKVNTTVLSMSVICIMLFVTICVLSSALSIRNSMMANINELAPADLELSKPVYQSGKMKEGKFTEEQIANSGLTIAQTLAENGIDLEACMAEYVSFYTHETKELTFADTMGGMLEEVQKQFKFLNYDSPEELMRISDYNRLAGLYGRKTYELRENEYMIVADFESMVAIRDQVLAQGQQITLSGRTFVPKYASCQDGILDISSNHINSGVILLPDDVLDEGTRHREYMIGNYSMASREDRQAFEDRLNALDKGKAAEQYVIPDGNSRLMITEASIGLGAMVTFIGFYLGVIFLISGAAVLALKELSESVDNVGRYDMLRKLGADEKMLNRALFFQIGLFFLFPLVLAVIHSVFGMMFSKSILETFGTEQIIPSIAMTAVLLAVVYGGYFIITYVCSRNIIRERR